MKRTLIKLLALIISLSAISGIYISRNLNHVAALEPGDPCPDCGDLLNADHIVNTPLECYLDPEIVILSCYSCGYETTKTYYPEPHNYVLAETVAATCTTDGKKKYICSNYYCTAEYEEVIPKGHNYIITSQKDATCTENGLVSYKCTRCNHTYDEVVEAAGHEYGEEKLDPTCL